MSKYLNRGISMPVAIGIIAISIIVVGGGVLTFLYLKTSNPKNSNSEIATPINSTTDNLTTEWKKYSNTFGYKFEYPDSTVLDSITDYGNEDLSTDSSKVIQVKDVNKKYLFFSVNNYTSSENLSPEYIKNQFGSIAKENIIITPTKVGGVSGYKVDFNNVEGVVSDFYFLEKFEQIFHITVLKNNETAQKIFSTFKFTSPIAPIGYPIQWQKSDDRSEHIGSKKAEFPIRKEGLNPYTKILEWPEIKNISNAQVVEKINEILNFNRNIEFTKFDATEYNGITDVSFKVNYDKNDILSLTFYVSTYGAYPDEYSFDKNFNLKTGNSIVIEDLTTKNKSDILTLLNQRLQTIKDNSKINGTMNDEYASELLQKAKFMEENLNNFKITDKGLEYNYDFGFPHVIQALQPSGLIILTWDELK